MTKIKAANLTGVQLRMAVAIADGWTLVQIGEGPFNELMIRITKDRDSQWLDQYDPTTDWSLGGPIIEREGINTRAIRRTGHKMDNTWLAAYDHGNTGEMVQWVKRESWPRHYFTGQTPLVAAMRCYVASKLGDEVELDAEGMLQCHA